MDDWQKWLLGIGAAGGLYGLLNMEQSPEAVLASGEYDFDPSEGDVPMHTANEFGRSDPLSAYPFARQSTFPEMGSTTDITDQIEQAQTRNVMGDIMIDGQRFAPTEGLSGPTIDWQLQENALPRYQRTNREITAPIARRELPDPGYFRGDVAPNPHSGYMPPTLDEYRMMQGIHGNPNLWNMR